MSTYISETSEDSVSVTIHIYMFKGFSKKAAKPVLGVSKPFVTIQVVNILDFSIYIVFATTTQICCCST